MTNDDQIPPAFALAGLRPSHDKYFAQLPPTWDLWLEALRLLVSYGASIHEAAHGMSFSELNVVRADRQPRTLELFHFLLAEGYDSFDHMDEKGYFAIFNALPTTDSALQCLKLLSSADVHMDRVFDDGRSIFHLAAELAHDVRVLEFIYENGGSSDLDRQDKWGWTPLHYAVICGMGMSAPESLQNVRFLVAKGAGPALKGWKIPHIFAGIELAQSRLILLNWEAICART
ncbi:ankyrin [Aspergillus affinis]|uniref:ankyrin n=1 Tax=Aspergillus affinis TaxID=1070780 RepID=UPI0022FE7174|nr:ankyrin [Aspergillus affinis]KAI9045527.1 ankyrin [Aspergillus affinis]